MESCLRARRSAIARGELFTRELAGAVLGRAAVLDSWRKDLARHQKEERAALGKAHQESAGEYERGVRRTYARDARRAVGGVLQARWTEAREREGAGTRSHSPPGSRSQSRPRLRPQQGDTDPGVI
ncbi:MAG: hypothetical protein OXN18_15495 [Gemmatimonadota bacterium]|nr:hypothetical protein [Gemmatimonadota bacterium]